MSRLNSSIKLVVIIGDLIFLLVAVITVVAAGLVSSGKIVALDFPEARRTSMFVLLLASAVIGCTIYGCCGAFNQNVREGFCFGRRVLCCHQFLLLTVFIMSIMQQDQLSNREKSIDLVIENVEAYPHYDLFERNLDKYFNKAYFEGNCAIQDDTYDKSSAWLMQWVDRNCPPTMSRSVCELPEEKKAICDTSCPDSVWNATSCCPSEDLCFALGLKESCPYNQCRVAVLTEARVRVIEPALQGLAFVAILAAIMIIFTCLLICYNPRDDIEIELLKTGVMTEEDVETIRKLKSQRNFSYEKGNGKGQQSIDLDTIHETRTQQANANRNRNQSQQQGLRVRFLNNDGARVHPEYVSP